MKDVIIIGGGGSGIVAAITASKKYKVTVLEKNNDILKKVLITGNGKCNYFNEDFNIKNYYTHDYDILEKIITLNNKNKVLDFFDSIGIVPRIKNGYYYPYSNQATTIKSMLMCEIKNRSINIVTDCLVNSIKKNNDTFYIDSSKGLFKSQKIILSTGTGAGYKENSNSLGIIDKFNFKFYNFMPALVQLKAKNPIKNCSGVRNDAILSLYIDNKFIKKESGEVQITDYGISGICTLNLSSIVSRNLDKKIFMNINFLPNLNKSEFNDYITKRNKKISNRTVIELLESLVHYKIIYNILDILKIKTNVYYDDLSKKEKDSLKKLLFSYPLEIIGTNDFSRAQVSTGGICLTEINPNTMQSKIKGLYLIGELLDVDGKCGGFNLGFAWITGLIAGELND